MGRVPQKVKAKFFEPGNGGKSFEKEVELFTWEKLDFVDKIKTTFGL